MFYRLLQNYPPDNLLIIGEKPDAGAETLKCTYLPLESFRRKQKRFHKLVNTLDIAGLINYQLPAHLEKAALDFKPDVVLTLLQSYMFYTSAYKFAKKHNLPLALFVHDQPEEFQKVYPPLGKKQLRLNAEVYGYASVRMNISQQMAKLFKNLYGYDGDVLYPMPSPALSARQPEENRSLKIEGKLTIGYAGKAGYGYSAQLEEMLPALEKSGSILKFYGVNLPDNLKRNSLVEYGGFEASAEATWEKIKKDCDAVILPYAWDEQYKRLYESHFPSKLPEYLSLGMPVIIVGPPYATGVIWGMNNSDSVLAMPERNAGLWESELLKLKSEAAYRLALGEAALKKRDEYFSPQVIENHFFKLLQKAISEHNRSL
ncbi:MAG: hypothetical protein K0S09_849 [Sphingobacteriaceae bacterium]|nr:hypothetical protein [Sphingobacteriaceae bacterium]